MIHAPGGRQKVPLRLVTMMTNRSSHMPTLTMSAITNSTADVACAVALNQSSCGARHVAENQQPSTTVHRVRTCD